MIAPALVSQSLLPRWFMPMTTMMPMMSQAATMKGDQL